MQSGFNHNVKYRGRLFHVQTEDAGVESAQVVTCIFCGGAIVSVARRSYRELLGRPDAREAVRDLMKVQHLEEIRRLYSGALDARIRELSADA